MTHRQRMKAFKRWLKCHGLPSRNVWRVEASILEDMEARGALDDPSKVVPVRARTSREAS